MKWLGCTKKTFFLSKFYFLQFAPYRFEIYELYVDVYLLTNRFREAQEISRRMFKQKGSHLIARSYVVS